MQTSVEEQNPALATDHADRAVQNGPPAPRVDGDPGYFGQLVDCADRRDRDAEQRDRHADVRDAVANARSDDTENARTDRGLASVDRFHAGRDRDKAASDRASFMQALRLDLATQQAAASLEHAVSLRALGRENRARARQSRDGSSTPGQRERD